MGWGGRVGGGGGMYSGWFADGWLGQGCWYLLCKCVSKFFSPGVGLYYFFYLFLHHHSGRFLYGLYREYEDSSSSSSSGLINRYHVKVPRTEETASAAKRRTFLRRLFVHSFTHETQV